MPTTKALRLTDSVTQLPRVGEVLARKLANLEIETVGDVLFHIPRTYEDWSTITAINTLVPNTTVTLLAEVELISNKRTARKRMMVTEALVKDETGSCKIIWFNQPFLTRMLQTGRSFLFSGDVQSNVFGEFLNNPAIESARSRPGLRAVYPQTAGVTSKMIRGLVDHVLAAVHVEDVLPADFLAQHGLLNLPQAVRYLHQPEHMAQAEQAKRRLQFEELLRYHARAIGMRRAQQSLRAPSIPFSESLAKEFVKSLPFTLTDGQRKAAWRILQDLEQPQPMHRLLQGDVGSGKTVVATMAMAHAAHHGFQAALLAPTEILAQQHGQSIAALLKPFGYTVALATSGGWEMLSGTGDPMEAQVYIGTHALIQKNVEFKKLGLVVVDEEHRFGVEQRTALIERGGLAGLVPHVLSMTATPIPRTLALTVYGGVDVSYLREKPAGRQVVQTFVKDPNQRPEVLAHMQTTIDKQEGIFVVCPLISSSDMLGVSSAEAEVKRLRRELPKARIGILHGRMSSEDKQTAMRAFRTGDIDILVSTAVVEVGVDIPRATVMVVEGAERFGLAQLHQLRGRIGRNDRPSTCFLHPTRGSEAYERLHVLETIQDGYQLAEQDLRLRGMGELFGTKQSGTEEWLQFGLPSLEMVEEAHAAAEGLWDINPTLAKTLAKEPR